MTQGCSCGLLETQALSLPLLTVCCMVHLLDVGDPCLIRFQGQAFFGPPETGCGGGMPRSVVSPVCVESLGSGGQGLSLCFSELTARAMACS